MIDLQTFAIKGDAVFDLAAQKQSQRFRSIGIGSRLTGHPFLVGVDSFDIKSALAPVLGCRNPRDQPFLYAAQYEV
jgi:hypothetical protein